MMDPCVATADPWVIPHFCYATFVIFTFFGIVQFGFITRLWRMLADQIYINTALAERVRNLEQSDD